MSLKLASLKQVTKDLFESKRWPDRPQTINFEITAACDARCIHCPRLDMDRPMKAMPMPLYRRLVDQSAELGVPYLCPNGYGEICTLPMEALQEYFGYLGSNAPQIRILINTNGNRMTEDRIALFLRHNVHLVNVTIDGATAETAESIRKNLHFDQIEANIKNLIAMRNALGKTRPKVRVGMVAMPQTVPEYDQFRKRWHGLADFIGLGGFSDRLTSVAAAAPQEALIQLGSRAVSSSAASACVLPFKELNIWADGKAVLCCEDWNEQHVIGDLNTQHLRDIWRGPEMTEVRRKHIAGEGHCVDLCSRCNAWKEPTWGARLWS